MTSYHTFVMIICGCVRAFAMLALGEILTFPAVSVKICVGGVLWRRGIGAHPPRTGLYLIGIGPEECQDLLTEL